jgi:hypothetical protein
MQFAGDAKIVKFRSKQLPPIDFQRIEIKIGA